MEDSEVYIKRKELQLARWQERVHELAAEVEGAGRPATSDEQFAVDVLKAKCAAAQVRLDALKEADGREWDALADSVERAWEDLRESFPNPTNRK